MSNFVTAFLSNNPINTTTARELFAQEKPPLEAIASLTDKLIEQQANDSLLIIAELIKENFVHDGGELRNKIALHLLIQALNDADKEKITLRLQELTLANDKQLLWQETIPKLISWVENTNDRDDAILLLLQGLPITQREYFYSRILESANGNPSWLNPLIKFILTQQEIKTIPTTNDPHLEKISCSILLSPTICHEKTRHLSLSLTTKQLVASIFHIRDNIAIYSSKPKEKLHQRFTEYRKVYIQKYEELATALTIRAKTSIGEYAELIHSNSEIANILMIKRLQLQTKPDEQKRLIVELLDSAKKYNLTDLSFKATTTEAIIQVFNELPLNQLIDYFKNYYDSYAQKNLSETNHFLERLFEKSHDKTKILTCIAAIDDNDKAVTINYITTCKHRHHELIQDCFQRLTETQLINLWGHINASPQAMIHETETLSSVYCRVLSKKIKTAPLPIKHITALANEVKSVDNGTSDCIKHFFSNFTDNLLIRYQWLHALFLTGMEKANFFAACQQLLKELKLQEQLSLLQCFSAEDLLAFYLYLLRHNASVEDFYCLVQLFRDTSKQSLLLFLLSNTPTINKVVLDQLMPLIEDKNLITLIYQLLEKQTNDDNYKTNFGLLLQHFCQRLQLSTQHKADIHQWLSFDKTKELALSMLENPICFQLLSSRSSLFQDYTPYLLQGYLVNSASADLQLRASRVLSLVEFPPDSIENIALTLLGAYYTSPKTLHTLFINLNDAQQSFEGFGRNSYTLLKRACWKLLKPKSELQFYSDEQINVFLTTQLTTAHCFDPLLAKLAATVSQSTNANLSAQYLALIETITLEQIPFTSLATILTKSLQEETKDNWLKIASHLKTQPIYHQVELIQSLLSQIKNSSDNPYLIEQTLQFILGLDHFETILPLLKKEELQWLIKECSAAKLIEKFPSWLSLILQDVKFSELDYCSLLILLPQDQPLLDTIYQCPELNPHLSTLFIQLSTQEATTIHLMAIFKQLSKESIEQKRLFISAVQNQTQEHHLSTTALLVINTLLLTIDDLDANQDTDVSLVLHHLGLIFLSTKQKSNNDTVLMSQQLVLNTLSFLIAQNSRWAYTILTTEDFAQAVLAWLKIEVAFEQHPLTKILLDNASLKFHPTLTQSIHYQEFIKRLLSSPPVAMNTDQFAFFFETLTPDKQQELALHILQSTTLTDVQWASIMMIAEALPITTIYNIYKQDKNRHIFVDLLARHHQGLGALQKAETEAILGEIKSGKQILRILDSYSSVTIKRIFIESIFSYLKTSNTPLLNWLQQLNFDAQTLAAFANYITNKEHQQQFTQVLDESIFYRCNLNDYLQNPTLEMALNQKGILFSLVRQAAINPWLGRQCHPKLQEQLTPSILSVAIPAQFQLLEQVDQLAAFYEPFSSSSEIANQILQSARWTHRLPLLSGLLQIFQDYNQKNPEFTALFQETKLYQQIYLPLTSQEKLVLLPEIQLNQLYELLADYRQKIKSDTQHHQQIDTCLHDFSNQLQTMRHFSAPKLEQLFRPDSYFGKIKNQQIRPLLATEVESLVNASRDHNEWLSIKLFSPITQLDHAFTLLQKKPQIFQNSQFRSWFLEYCLFSPLAENVHEDIVQQLVLQFPPNELSIQLTLIHRQQEQFSACYIALQKLCSQASIAEIIQNLYIQPQNTIELQLNACKFLHQPHISNLLDFVLQAKIAKLTYEQTVALSLPEHLSNNSEVEWIRIELNKFPLIENEFTRRCQKIAIWGLSATEDNQNLSRLNSLSNCSLTENNIAIVLNSYLPIFSNDENKIICQKFLSFLENHDSEAEKLQLIKKLDEPLLKKIIHFASKNPKEYEALLQKIINAGFGQQCTAQINSEIRFLVTNSTEKTEEPFQFEKITTEEFVNLTKQQCIHILRLQRLAFHVNPLAELNCWEAPANFRTNYMYFCADASLYNSLCNLKKQIATTKLEGDAANRAQKNLEACFHYLKEEARIIAYHQGMETFLKNLNTLKPAVYYHCLCLLSFLFTNNVTLISEFLSWLHAIEDCELEKQNFLPKLLRYILDNNLLNDLCKELAKTNTMTAAKSTWLFEQIIQSGSSSQDFIQNIALGFSWDWLKGQINHSTLSTRTLLETTLTKDNHVKTITENSTNQLTLFNILKESQLSAKEIINLHDHVSHPTIKAIILSSVLTNKEYIKQLQQESIPDQIAVSFPLAQNINALILQLQLDQLPLDIIKQFQPEAAAYLLCSIKEFHLLNSTLIEPLLQSLGDQADRFIQYWLSHYSVMPNSDVPLIAFINSFSKKIIPALSQLAENQRHHVLNSLIEHLDKLALADLRQLIPLMNEAHLVYAAHLYLYERQTTEHNVTLIMELATKLLEKKDNLTSQTIQLLMRLSENTNFMSLQSQLGKASGDYLRGSTFYADCSIFYDEGYINIKRMQKLIPLQTDVTNTETQQSVLRTFTKPLMRMIITEEKTEEPTPTNVTAPHPLITLLAKEKTQIQSIDYFLIHYNGKAEALRQCFNDYLDCLGRESLIEAYKLDTIAWLLHQSEIPSNTKQIIFDSLLARPKWFDSHVCAGLLTFDVQKCIHHFGMNGDYSTLVNLCSRGLPLLHGEISNIAKVALREAEFELSMTKISGFLAKFRIWFKRSLFYGWETWFQPKGPQYVLPYDQKPLKEDSTDVILQELNHTDTTAQSLVHPNKTEELYELESLLECIDNSPSLLFLTNLKNALDVYNWQKPQPNEEQNRETIDKLFTTLLLRSGTYNKDKELSTWLMQHLEPFITNRKRLIELYMKTRQHEKLDDLLAKASQGPGNFSALVKLLSPTNQPELLQGKSEIKDHLSSQSLLGAVANGLSTISGLFWTQPGETTTENPSEKSWLDIILFK